MFLPGDQKLHALRLRKRIVHKLGETEVARRPGCRWNECFHVDLVIRRLVEVGDREDDIVFERILRAELPGLRLLGLEVGIADERPDALLEAYVIEPGIEVVEEGELHIVTVVDEQVTPFGKRRREPDSGTDELLDARRHVPGDRGLVLVGRNRDPLCGRTFRSRIKHVVAYAEVQEHPFLGELDFVLKIGAP